MVNAYERKSTGKLLAAVLAILMVFSAVAIVSSDSVNAATWNMDGDINADQPIQAGTDAVATGNFNVTNNSELTIRAGASFVVNEGVTVTIVKGSTLTIESGAAVEINGRLVIQDGATLQNGADYDGVNTVSRHYNGLVVNGTIDAARGATITGAPIADAISIPSTGYGSATEISTSTEIKAVEPASEYVSGTLGGSFSKATDSDNYIVILSGATISKHLNANADEGCWVAVQLSSNITEESEPGIPVDITYNGRASNSDDYTLTGGAVNIWLNAGSVYNVVVEVGEKTINLTIDTTQVVGGQYQNSESDGCVGGTIVVGSQGTVTTASSNNTRSTFEHQTVLLNVGATFEINSITVDVNVQAIPSTDRYPYTYGALGINTQSGWENPSNPVDLMFTVTSERISAAYTGPAETDRTTRATNYILNIDGDINAGNFVRVVATPAISGQYTTLYYPNADDDGSSGVPMYGIVSVSGTLDVNGQRAQFSATPNSIVNVSGTLNVAGNNDGAANIYMDGTLNVSGAVNIDSVNPTSGENSVNLNINTNSYFNIIGTGVITIDDYEIDGEISANINGAAYNTDDSAIITSLQTALDGAVAAEEDIVHVFGYDAETGVTLGNPYVISSNITIPDDMTLCIDGIVSVSEGATLTFSVNSEIDTDSKGLIDVSGTVMDYSMYGFGDEAATDYASVTNGDVKIKAEVRSIDADETYYMYTTLRTALAGNPGTVELYGTVDVEGTLTIPEGFTVDLNGKTMNVTNEATLVINGIVETNNGQIVVYNKTADEDAGAITLNNMIVDPVVKDNTAPTAADYTVAGFTANGTIGDYENFDFALAPAVAAANSATLSDITAVGKFTYSGELTFTAGEDNEGETIIIGGTEISIGTITLDGFSLTLQNGKFTGTVQTAVTAGTSAVDFNKAVGYTVSVSEDDSGEEIVTEANLAQLSTANGQVVGGNVTISAGTVYLISDMDIGGTTNANTLTVAEGATFVVTKDNEIDISSMDYNAPERDEYAVVTVDGTLTIEDGGDFTYTVGSDTIGDQPNQLYYNAIVRINGTMNVQSDITFQSNVYVDGTLAVSIEEDNEGSITVPADARIFVNGTVIGAIDIEADGYIYAYPGASVDSENLNLQDDGTTTASSTAVYINGNLYMTVYGLDEATIVEALPTDEFEVPGYADVIWPSEGTQTNPATQWFSDAEYQNNIDISVDALEDAPAIYAKLNPLNADVQVSVGQGISVYVDGVRVDGLVSLPYNQSTVGTHTVEYTIDPGYTGEATITFNGQTVANGGTFEITPEMTSSTADALVLSVSGNITTDSTVVIDGGSDSGMGLTDYLLIILVILIVVMAIMVAMRLMRS